MKNSNQISAVIIEYENKIITKECRLKDIPQTIRILSTCIYEIAMSNDFGDSKKMQEDIVILRQDRKVIKNMISVLSKKY